MPNTSRKNNLNQNINPYLSTLANWKSNRGDVHILMKRLKKKEKKASKEKFFFVAAAIGVFVVSGIIISF